MEKDHEKRKIEKKCIYMNELIPLSAIVVETNHLTQIHREGVKSVQNV